MTGRLKTVHDLSALRLHSDGSRVKPNAKDQVKKRSHVVKDSAGNWIATDAGGHARVKQRWSKPKSGQSREEDEGYIKEKEKNEVTVDRKGKGKASVEDVDEEPRIILAKRKRPLEEDVEAPGTDNADAAFHVSTPHLLQEGDSQGSQSADWPAPTSDLLKCIHYYASTYYSEMGQLRDTTGEYRREKKQKQLALSMANTTRLSQRADQGVSADGNEGYRDEANIQLGNTEGLEAKRMRRRSRVHGGEHLEKDMYRVCEGSALMAIGMLVQEHISQLLSTRIPEGWVEAEDQEVSKTGRGLGRPKKYKGESENEEMVIDEGSGEEDEVADTIGEATYDDMHEPE